MAITSKINIDIDSAAFAAFQEKFDKYKAALDKTPAAWKGVGAEVTKAKTGFEAVANSIATQAGTMALISKHSSDFYVGATLRTGHGRHSDKHCNIRLQSPIRLKATGLAPHARNSSGRACAVTPEAGRFLAKARILIRGSNELETWSYQVMGADKHPLASYS